MGGVIRTNKAIKIFKGGEEINSLYYGGEQIWLRPEKSTLPTPALLPNENILFVGSSVLGCAMAATWSTGRHNFYNTFRNATIGNTSSLLFPFEQTITLRGAGCGITFGNTDFFNIANNARNGQYTNANPFDASINQYDCLVIEMRVGGLGSVSEGSSLFPYLSDTVKYRQSPLPFDLTTRESQEGMVRALSSLMDVIRAARGSGISKIYISCNMPSLLNDGVWADNEDPIPYGRIFDSTNKTHNYIQDKLNQQIDIEGLGGHINMIPHYKAWERVYNDFYIDETSPAELTDFRRLWSTANNADGPEVAVTTTDDRHHYMKSYWGGYLLSALTAAIIYDIDPRVLPNTDGTLTLPENLANYFKQVAYDVKATSPRAGRVRGDSGYKYPRLNQGSLQDILGDKIIYERNENITENITDSFPSKPLGHIFIIGRMVEPESRVETNYADAKITLTNGNSSMVYAVNFEARMEEPLRVGHAMPEYPGYPHNVFVELINNTSRDEEGAVFFGQFKAFNSYVEDTDYGVDNYIRLAQLDKDMIDMWADGSYNIATNAEVSFLVPSPINYNSITLKPIENFIVDKILVTEVLTNKEVEEVLRALSKEIGVGSVTDPNSFLFETPGYEP